jgi:DNA invertase Pin-like site-specific DNA recombinase
MNEKNTPFSPPPRPVGYARVSTSGQTLEAQLEQLTVAGCATIYRETASGAKSDRKQLRRMLAELQPGDVVTVTRIDRLARSIFDLFTIVRRIAEAGAQFRSLAEPLVDTNTSTGRMMLAVLGGLADIERDLIKTRTAEGRSRAKARGQSLGRPRKLSPAQQQEACERLANKETLVDIARSYNVSHTTIRRLKIHV